MRSRVARIARTTCETAFDCRLDHETESSCDCLDHDLLQGDYLDSGLLVRVGNERIGGTFAVTNLADSEGNHFALGTPFALVREQVTPLRPRTIRIGIDFSF